MSEFTLGQKQRIFPKLLAQLIDHAYSLGFELEMGQAERSHEEAARLHAMGRGILNSNHIRRIAQDFYLFIDGVYQSDSESYRPLGEFWESLSVPGSYTCIWGGRFSDGGHFSIEWQGIK